MLGDWSALVKSQVLKSDQLKETNVISGSKNVGHYSYSGDMINEHFWLLTYFKSIEKMYQKLLSNHLVCQGSPRYSLVFSPVANTHSNDGIRMNRKITMPTSLTLAMDQKSVSLGVQIADSESVGTGRQAR